jgi:long-chain acyl-CoA synthetase
MAQLLAPNLIGFDQIPQTIPHFCIESFRLNNKPDALAYKIGDVWHRLSGSEAIERIRNIALGLSALGVKAGDKLAIISENRPEWSLTDLAILSLKAVNVPIYTTQAVEQIRYILEDSGAKMLFVSGKKLLKHAEEAIRSVETIEKLVFFDPDAKPDDFGIGALGQFGNPLRGGLGQSHDLRARPRLRLGDGRG